MEHKLNKQYARELISRLDVRIKSDQKEMISAVKFLCLLLLMASFLIITPIMQSQAFILLSLATVSILLAFTLKTIVTIYDDRRKKEQQMNLLIKQLEAQNTKITKSA